MTKDKLPNNQDILDSIIAANEELWERLDRAKALARKREYNLGFSMAKEVSRDEKGE